MLSSGSHPVLLLYIYIYVEETPWKLGKSLESKKVTICFEFRYRY